MLNREKSVIHKCLKSKILKIRQNKSVIKSRINKTHQPKNKTVHSVNQSNTAKNIHNKKQSTNEYQNKKQKQVIPEIELSPVMIIQYMSCHIELSLLKVIYIKVIMMRKICFCILLLKIKSLQVRKQDCLNLYRRHKVLICSR